MINNNKYFSAGKIHHRLSQRHKNKMSGYSYGDIVGMCAEVEIEILGNHVQFEPFEKVELTVIDGKALTPCNIYRILDVFTSDNTRIFNYHYDGDKISFSEESNYVPSNNSKVYINYYGIPLDDEGYPMFLKGHEQALYWGCLVRMYEEDYAEGKIHPNTYNDFTIRYESHLNAAESNFRHTSKNDIKEWKAVIFNAIQKPNRIPLFKTN